MSANVPPPPPPPVHPVPPVPGPPPGGPSGGRKALVVGVVVALLLTVTGGAVVSILALRSGGSQDDGSGTGFPPPSTAAPTTGPSEVPTTGPTAGTTPGPDDPALRPFYTQQLDWQPCGRDECTYLKVPMDYTRPTGRQLQLAVLKVPAQQPARRIGSLVVNPGGPGGSGVDYAAAGSLQFGAPLSDRYDIVGFDPRGVGRSDPLDCAGTAQTDALIASDPDPDTPAEVSRMDRLIGDYGKGCLKNSGALTRHVSTEEVARDMDILRAGLGEKKLDYLGASYGTYLGATYANLFPDRVGRFVLDGALDPALSNLKLSLVQAHGFEVALRSYIADCVASSACVLGDSVEAGVARVQQLLADLDARPLPTDDPNRPLTEGLGMLGIWMPLYAKSYWPTLTSALTRAISNGDGSGLLGLADIYTSRGAEKYTDNSMAALYAVNCLDHGDYVRSSQVPRYLPRFEKASPTFGRAFAYGLSACSTWPVHSDKMPEALHAAGAPPIVVIGTTRDPATPLTWARALARELDSGRLITRDGDGHTAFQRGNACVDDAVESWLLDGKVPAANLRC